MISHIYVCLLKFLIHKNHAKQMKKNPLKRLIGCLETRHLPPPIILDLCNELGS